MKFARTDVEEGEREIISALRKAKRNCPSPDLLLALEQGVLPPKVATAIVAHLQSCRICDRLTSDLGQLSLSEPTLAEVRHLRQRVLQKISGRPQSAGFSAIAASILILASVAAYWELHARKTDFRPAAVLAPQASSPATYRLPLRKAPLRPRVIATITIHGNTVPKSAMYLRALGEALAPYQSDNFPEAAHRLESLAERYPTSADPLFYLAVTRLLSGDPARALPTLKEAQRIGGTPLAEDIEWYLAISHERLGNFSESRVLLRHLCNNQTTYRQLACDALRSKP